MSAITGKIKSIWARFQSKEYRDAFVASRLRTGIAYQVVAMREARGWTQADLADQMGTKQPFVSRIESASDSLTLASAKKIASAFDVAVELRFVPFSEHLRSTVEERLDAPVPPFEEDHIPAAMTPIVLQPMAASTGVSRNFSARIAGGRAWPNARVICVPTSREIISANQSA